MHVRDLLVTKLPLIVPSRAIQNHARYSLLLIVWEAAQETNHVSEFVGHGTKPLGERPVAEAMCHGEGGQNAPIALAGTSFVEHGGCYAAANLPKTVGTVASRRIETKCAAGLVISDLENRKLFWAVKRGVGSQEPR